MLCEGLQARSQGGHVRYLRGHGHVSPSHGNIVSATSRNCTTPLSHRRRLRARITTVTSQARIPNVNSER